MGWSYRLFLLGRSVYPTKHRKNTDTNWVMTCEFSGLDLDCNFFWMSKTHPQILPDWLYNPSWSIGGFPMSVLVSTLMLKSNFTICFLLSLIFEWIFLCRPLTWNARLPSGAEPQGNTCYLNAILQCIVHTPLLYWCLGKDSLVEISGPGKNPHKNLAGAQILSRPAMEKHGVW